RARARNHLALPPLQPYPRRHQDGGGIHERPQAPGRRGVTEGAAVSRRGFLLGGVCAVAGGLVVASSSRARALSQAVAGAGKAPAAPEVTAWIVIEANNKTVIRVARRGMGQGALTSLPMLVAEELE